MRATTGPWQLWKKSPLPGLAELRLIGRPGAGLRALAVSPGPGIAASRPGTRPQSSRAPPRSTWNSRRRTRGPRPIARRLQPALWRLLFSDPAGRRCPCGAGGRAAARADRSPAPADAAAPPERGVHDLAPNQIRRRPHRRRPKKARTDDRDPESRGLPPQAAFLVITHNPTYYWAGARIPSRSNKGAYGRASCWCAPAPCSTATCFSTGVSGWGSRSASWPCRRSAGCRSSGDSHSVAQMDRVTQQIAEGRFDVQVAHHRRDELGHLGEQINRLAARLQSFVKTRSVFWAISRTNSAPPSPASNSRSGFWSRKQPRPISRTWPCSTKRFWRCRAW